MLSNECKTFFPYFKALETNSALKCSEVFCDPIQNCVSQKSALLEAYLIDFIFQAEMLHFPKLSEKNLSYIVRS